MESFVITRYIPMIANNSYKTGKAVSQKLVTLAYLKIN